MKPSEAYEAIADIMTQTVKKPYRDEPITFDEWETISYRIVVFIQERVRELGGKA